MKHLIKNNQKATKKLKQNIETSISNYKLIFSDKNFILKYRKALEILKKSLKNKGKIIFAGNGGSAADAQHLSAELTGRYLKNRKSISSISITTDTSAITSIANDISYKKIFTRQLEGIANKNDLFFSITTSGKSENIIDALSYCKSNNIKSLCLTKKKYPKKLDKLADIVLDVPANRVDRIQEMHIFIGHNLCEELENTVK
tara:strand:+ start:449 stop:1054 length:606 start_codon:yes stop_codon:yes gene_type:complete